jgi:flagellar hook protein FlgE
LKVQGFTADDKGKITSKMGDISVDRTVVDANKTSQVNMFMNLDLRADKAKVFDPEMPENSSHFSTGVTVYDSAGTAHVVTMFFNKVEDGTWQWNAMAKGEEVQDGIPGKMMLQASGKLLFDSDGKLKTQAIDQNSFNFSGGAIPDQAINFDFGVSKEQGGPGNQVTQYGTESQAYKQTQDGYSAGTLSGLTFNDDGTLAAVYSNGQNLTLAQLGLAKFENNEGLFKLGQNRYRESRLSGSPTIGAPMTGGRASIVSKALESSTTDIAQEFINLMTAQRGFQANTKVITASDEMMQDVLNIKRG